MDDEKKARQELFGAQCTLGYWDRYSADVAARRLKGASPQAGLIEHIEQNRAYWLARIGKLEKWLAERPADWGSW